MKKTLLLAGLFLSSLKLHAQEKLEALTAPTSPAASVIGMQPTAIMTPKSYQSLESALYSNFMNDGKIGIPNDFALEFSPYWTKNHALSLEDYLNPKHLWKDQICRNSSFSMASTQKFALGDSSSSNAIGFGYRTTLFFGNPTDADSIAAYRSFINNELTARTSIIPQAKSILEMDSTKNQFLRDIEPYIKSHVLKNIIANPDSAKVRVQNAMDIIKSVLPELKKDEDSTHAFLQKFTDALDSAFKFKETNEKFKGYIRHRQGLFIDMAYASFVSFPTNNFEYSIIPKQAVWVTPMYRLRLQRSKPGVGSNDQYYSIKFLGVLRYEWFQREFYRNYFPNSTVYQNNFDYGAAIAMEFSRFSFQFEAIGRASRSETPAGTDVSGNKLYTKQTGSDFQCTGAFSYRINDQIALTYTFGKGFKPIFNAKSTLVSLLSLNLGFGGPTTKNLK